MRFVWIGLVIVGTVSCGLVGPWVAARVKLLSSQITRHNLPNAERLTLSQQAVFQFDRERWYAAAFNFVLFLAMVSGILCNYFWLFGLRAPHDWSQFFRPVLVSPIVFLSVYMTVTKQPRGLVPILIAFQNGFFWQTIFASAGPTVTT